MGTYAQSTDLVLRLLDPARRAGAITYLADSADTHLFQTVWLAIGRWTDSAETVVAMLRARGAVEKKSGNKSNISVFALPSGLAARGHVREASALTTFPALLAQYAMTGAIPRDSVTQLARTWIDRPGDGILYVGPLLAGVHDTASIGASIRKVEAVRLHPPANFPPVAKDFFGYLLASQHAYLALAKGDTAEALRLFDSRPDTAAFGGSAIDDLVHAQLLLARGRASDAVRLLERPLLGVSPAITPVEILRSLERGRVYERIGNKDLAIDGYSLVVRAWRNPDPELQPYVTEARAALVRLAGEKH
jgi:hypothetical protein